MGVVSQNNEPEVFLAHVSYDEETHRVLSVHATMDGAKAACVAAESQRRAECKQEPPEPQWTIHPLDTDPTWETSPPGWGPVYWVETTTVHDTYGAADLAKVPVGTIWSWASRGKLTAVGIVNGVRYYAAAEVIRVEAATRRRPRMRRLASAAAKDLQG